MAEVNGFYIDSSVYRLRDYAQFFGEDRIERVVLWDFYLTGDAIMDQQQMDAVWLAPASVVPSEAGGYNEYFWRAISPYIDSVREVPGETIFLPRVACEALGSEFLLVINDNEGGNWVFSNSGNICEVLKCKGFKGYGVLTKKNAMSYIPMAGIDVDVLENFIHF